MDAKKSADGGSEPLSLRTCGNTQRRARWAALARSSGGGLDSAARARWTALAWSSGGRGLDSAARAQWTALARSSMGAGWTRLLGPGGQLLRGAQGAQ
eukprot:5713787-Prymnesium_polylepis.1